MRSVISVLLTVLITFSLFGCTSDVAETAPDYDDSPLNDMDEIQETYPDAGNIPSVYIDLFGDDLIHLTKDEYMNAEITVRDCGIIEASGGIKGRGNASWGLPQKPLTISFDEPRNVLGLGKSRKWVAITSYYDKSLLRNYLSLMLAKEMNVSSAVDFSFVNIFINNDYYGLYLLTDKIRDGDASVDICKSDGDVLFEIEQGYRHGYDCGNCIWLRSGTHVTFKEPRPSDLTKEEFGSLYKSINESLSETDSLIRKGKFDEYSQRIDIDSFVNWYILNEFVKNYDSSFVTSCYCYIKDGILYMGPAWDYDTCMGNQDSRECFSPEGFWISESAPWYVYLCKNREFSNRIRERWTELYSDGLFERLPGIIDKQTEYLKESSELEFRRWPDMITNKDLRGKKSTTDYLAELEYLKDWIQKRTDWLNSKWSLEGENE